MAFGPIDVIALEFKDSRFDPAVLACLTELVSSEVLRILDLVIVRQAEAGAITVLELHELEPEACQALEPLRAENSGLVTLDDIHLIAARLRPHTLTAILLCENLWAVRLRQEMGFVGGRLAAYERIPQEVVAEAVEELARLF